MVLRHLKTFASLLTAPLLAGCLLSSEPLLSDESAETPFAPGRYEVAQINEAGRAYEPLDKLTLSLNGNRYAMVEDQQQERVEFTLHAIGDGLFAAMAKAEDDIGYAMLRQDGDAIMGWAATCQVADQNGLLGKHGIETDGLGCSFSDAESLTAFLKDYAAAEMPDYRYTALTE